MTFYEIEIKKIKVNINSNKGQLDMIIGIKKNINNNFDKDRNLEYLSNTSFVSKYHLFRLFERYYGQTPKQYLTEKRIERSKEYLKKGMTISDACYSVGFESHCSFSTLFKNRTGSTPTAFQKEQFSQIVEMI